MAMSVHQAGLMLANPAAYTDEPALYEALALLREHAPVHWCTPPRYRPFWAITRHADIRRIEHNHTVFINGPRAMLMSAARDRTTVWARHLIGLNLMVQMDGTHHLAIRKISTDWFRPKVMRQLRHRIDDLAQQHVTDLLETGISCDFAQHPAARYPLATLLVLLGLPEGDLARLRSLTSQLLGTDDPDLQLNSGPFAQPIVLFHLFNYFQKVVESRRAHPTDDLASAIANARIDGEYLSRGDTLSYFAVIATGGHDTTSACIAGGLSALARHPDQFALLKHEPDLLGSAVQEMIRFTTPFKGFMRTATRDYDLHGTTIRQGDAVFLSYPAANRDDTVFDHPDTFDITRNPNPHVAFGHGIHGCLGAALAQMEISAFFAHLIPEVDAITPNGDPQLIATTFTGGYKHLPLRFARTREPTTNHPADDPRRTTAAAEARSERR